MKLDAKDLMEDNKLNVKKPTNPNSNKSIIAIIIAIIITIIAICVIVALMQEIEPISESLKVYVDGVETKVDTSIFLFEDDDIYVDVKAIAGYVGYEAHSGEYKIEAEDANKVFVENKQETASMFLNSTTISKIEPDSNEEYKNYTMSEPAREVNGDIYVISDGIQIACNIKLSYNASQKTIYIESLDYIYNYYNEAIQSMGYVGIDDAFENQKAILYDRIVVQNTDERYGVINAKGDEIIGTRYSYVEFDEYNKEFTITNAYGKVGIDYIDGETKINVSYDEIHSINKENGLYVVKNNNKYGVINGSEKIVIYLEYDEIGIDISPYVTTQTSSNTNSNSTTNSSSTTQTEENETVKQYIFFDALIPVQQNNMWGFFDLNGNKLTELKYTGIGCKIVEEDTSDSKSNKTTTTTTTKTTNNLLTLDDYELIVIEQNEKYGLLDTNGNEIIKAQAEDMYPVTNAGVKTYYMVFNGKTYNLETDLFDTLGIKKKSEEEESEENQSDIITSEEVDEDVEESETLLTNIQTLNENV